MLIMGMGLFLFSPSFLIGIILAGSLAREGLSAAILFGFTFALMVWMAASLLAYLQGDDKLVKLAAARKVSAADHPRLYNIVEELKIASGLTIMPVMYIIDDPAMNAFAVGCHRNKAAIIVTSGLLAKLNRDELQGVIAHEMAHIKNRDVMLMVLCAALLDSVTFLCWLFIPLLRFKNFLLGRGRWLIVLLVFLIFTVVTLWRFSAIYGSPDDFAFTSFLYYLGFIVLSPLAAQLICNAVLRKREYLADASSALYTRYPEGLASALEKIAASTEQLMSANMTTAIIYIVNPFREKGMAANDITETHPPISDRVGILRSMSHISYGDYDRAYQKIRNTDGSILPGYATSIPDISPIRSSKLDNMDSIQRTRETSNMLWNLNNYKLISCPCGTKMRLPPSYKQPEIKCPHCGRINAV